MDDEQDALREQLASLEEEHRDLDAAVAALEGQGATDLLQIKRLKKRKLQLKDEIRRLHDQLLPDITA